MSKTERTPSLAYPTFTDILLPVISRESKALTCYCNLCGLLVGNRDIHREWHDALMTPSSTSSGENT